MLSEHKGQVQEQENMLAQIDQHILPSTDSILMSEVTSETKQPSRVHI